MKETPEVWAIRTRREQGFPDHVEDPAVLDELAAMVLETIEADQRGDGR
jgi:hypothetical protein